MLKPRERGIVPCGGKGCYICGGRDGDGVWGFRPQFRCTTYTPALNPKPTPKPLYPKDYTLVLNPKPTPENQY
jgi:hypothetical protein